MPHTLIIRHMGEYRFQVWRPDGKAAHEVELPPPETIKVEGRPTSNLALDLRWYLEKFLDYPKPPNTELAARILKTLEEWAEDCFKKLFKDRARDWYQDARREGLENLSLKIAADEPTILAWPWEALKEPEVGTLAHACRIERQLSELHDPLPLPDNLPADCINILLVIARPYGDQDVGYHALSRPLVEMLESSDMPVRLDVLRPPSFAALRERLKTRAGFYHIVHFDGHGGYGDSNQATSTHSPYEYKGQQGLLVFENEQGGEQLVDAAKLTALLTEHRIPVMVLNACQSAGLDENAEGPFASVAASLLKAGVRGVVAMAYNLYVSGAQQFVPAFYQRLLESSDVAEATRAGRGEMLRNDQRVCLVGTYKLQDWLVPVLYQQDAQAFPVEQLQAVDKDSGPSLPDEARELGDYGFIGRQSAIQALERAIQRQKAAGILIHGMAGIGKTTLAKGFLNWLRQTNGFSREGEPNRFDGAFWFSFDDIHSAEHVVNQLVEAIFGHEATVHPLNAKLEALTQALRENSVLMVWDNFQSASGIEGSEVTPLLDDADRNLLKQLLHDLRDGKSKVLITSRSPETWLSATEAYRMPLGGLHGEESWEYCNAVVADLGLRIDRDDEAYAKLMDELGGHPLVMRAVLLRLAENIPPAKLLDELKQYFVGAEGDESTRRIFAALELLNQGLSEDFAPVLRLIGLHRRYVVFDHLEHMHQAAVAELDRNLLKQCFGALENGGLLHHIGDGIYAMPSALSGYLSARHAASEVEQRAFVDFMGRYADQLAPKQLHEQRHGFTVHGASFHHALELAREISVEQHVLSLTQSLASYARNRRDFAGAASLLKMLAKRAGEQNNYSVVTSAYHQLGRVAQERRDFMGAEQWYKKSLAITEKLGDEHGAAITYHQLGMIAEACRDYEAAESWYKKSLVIKETHDNEHGVAPTYHQLGIIAQERRDYEVAESWYKKSLAITEKLGDEHGAAPTYHQLGIIAQERRDYETAESWYKKSLAITEKLGIEHYAAQTYHQLGSVVQERRDYETAESWYKKSLFIKEKHGDKHGAAATYHQMGSIAQAKNELEIAKVWFRKSFEIEEMQGNDYGVATTNYCLGVIAKQQGNYSEAKQLLKASSKIFDRIKDFRSYFATVKLLAEISQDCGDNAKAEAWYRLALQAGSKFGPDLLLLDVRLGYIVVLQKQNRISEALKAVHAFLIQFQKNQGLLNSCDGRERIVLVASILRSLEKIGGSAKSNAEANYQDVLLEYPDPSVIEKERLSSMYLAMAWHLLGDRFREKRTKKYDLSTKLDARQTPEEADAYRYAAMYYDELISWENASELEPLVLVSAYRRIQTLAQLGAWEEGLLFANELHMFIKKLESVCKVEKNRISHFKAHIFLESANLMRLLGDYERAAHRFNDARRLFARLEDSFGQIACLYALAILYVQSGEVELASRELDKIYTFGDVPRKYRSRVSQLAEILGKS